MFKKRTIWAGLAIAGIGMFRLAKGDLEGLQTIAEGLAVIFGRAAISKIENDYKKHNQ